MDNKVIFYSRNGEDFILWKFFRMKGSGFYIDVGSFDGVHFSNTYIFEKIGWKGICIDAHPFYFQKCKENRPGSICIHAACTGDESVKEVMFHSEELGLLSGIQMREDIRQRYEGRGLTFEGFKVVTVPSVTLNSVLRSLKDTPAIDFISIDVEGHELEILKGFGIESYRPRILVVEANTELDEMQLDDYLVRQKGYYKARRVVENLFYCREFEDVRMLGKIKINCDLEISRHPLGEKYNLPVKKPVHKGFLEKILEKLKGYQ